VSDVAHQSQHPYPLPASQLAAGGAAAALTARVSACDRAHPARCGREHARLAGTTPGRVLDRPLSFRGLKRAMAADRYTQ
jgi:hypothetical protein